jgi:hypothetical protein
MNDINLITCSDCGKEFDTVEELEDHDCDGSDGVGLTEHDAL